MALASPLALASLLALAAAATAPGSSWSAVPRQTVPYAELKDAAKRFSQGGVSHYLTLTLDEAEALLYVGAREAVFALATGTVELKAAISWEAPVDKKAECIQKGKNNQTDCFNYVRFLQSYNSSHLYACGTYAFQPKCTYIELSGFTLDQVAFEDGKGKCPYDPTKGHTGLIVDGELYSATFNNFLGTEPVILRNLGPHYSMKTEYLTSWLNEPHFVASAYVQESAASSTGDDDKVYFFFSERAVEYDCYAEQVVARVARVCKGDVGGARTLQKKWTTFLKARLVCSAPEQGLHFNRLQAVFTLPGADWQGTTFFGVFQARWGDVDVSAVCQYHILEVKKAFEGPYKEYREQAQKWGRYSDEVPSPRPGAVSAVHHRLAPPERLRQLAGAARQHPQLRQEAPADGRAHPAAPRAPAPPQERRQLHPAGGRPGVRAGRCRLRGALHRHRRRLGAQGLEPGRSRPSDRGAAGFRAGAARGEPGPGRPEEAALRRLPFPSGPVAPGRLRPLPVVHGLRPRPGSLLRLEPQRQPLRPRRRPQRIPAGPGRAELRHPRLRPAAGGQARANHPQKRDGGGGHRPGADVPFGLQPGPGAVDLRGPGAGDRAGAGAARLPPAGSGGAGSRGAAQRHVPLLFGGAGSPLGRRGVPGGGAGRSRRAVGDAGAAGEPGAGVGGGRVPGRPVPGFGAGGFLPLATAAGRARQRRQSHREHPGVPHRAAQGAPQSPFRAQRRFRLGREALGPGQLLLLGRLAQNRAGSRRLPQRRPSRRRLAAQRHSRPTPPLAHPHPPGSPPRFLLQRLHPPGAGRRRAAALRRFGRGAPAQAAAAPAPARLQPRRVVGLSGRRAPSPPPGSRTYLRARPGTRRGGPRCRHPAPGHRRLGAGTRLGHCQRRAGARFGSKTAAPVPAPVLGTASTASAPVFGTGLPPRCQHPSWALPPWHQCTFWD